MTISTFIAQEIEWRYEEKKKKAAWRVFVIKNESTMCTWTKLQRYHEKIQCTKVQLKPEAGSMDSMYVYRGT